MLEVFKDLEAHAAAHLEVLFHELAMSWDAGLGQPFAGELGIGSRAVVEVFLEKPRISATVCWVASMVTNLFIFQVVIVYHIKLGGILRANTAPASLWIGMAFVRYCRPLLKGQCEEFGALECKVKH